MSGRTAIFVVLGLGLAGCDGDGGLRMPFDMPGRAAAGEGSATGGSVQLVERDLEAPEVFQVTEQGLWDGRPSLGGVWVAHPDVTDPERVIIRNRDNGKFVIGALFRRERENPGPRLQVSSDAADALGVLAGAPVELNVTALRREEAAETAPAAAASAAEAGLDAPAAVETTSLAPAAESAAPVAEAATPPAPAPAPVETASTLEKPYIQIGIFSIESNAEGTADRMRAAGIVPTVLAQESQGSPFWRVIVGPARDAAERERLLEKVKAQGFADAYAVTN
ncbi:lipoprotein, putative [Oceanicola granulosus HTCC2516]|uniref:Lipoprotein, putative n=1 Tax=Oceanicola granulosus (strain ATCC BAA-861 / DSM 15982 / KCTC 12143 / HTCC2516) TaxID=314256 RepID=Q2CCC1_OCEGH|nr:lipoprotein, putative [Oceanicola granulosus HTCC2516]